MTVHETWLLDRAMNFARVTDQRLIDAIKEHCNETYDLATIRRWRSSKQRPVEVTKNLHILEAMMRVCHCQLNDIDHLQNDDD